ncbi:putative IQ motif, EF-hand binding protein [Plasmopara halstedii]
MHRRQEKLDQQYWQRYELRIAAARQIQRVFRGWRARQRVVHRVRVDMEHLIADIQHQLDGEWLLLGLAAAKIPSFSLDWGPDAKLRLPRMEDLLFGVSINFPISDINYEQQGELSSSPSENEQATSPSCSRKSTVDLMSPDKGLSIAPVVGSASESHQPTSDIDVIDTESLRSFRDSSNTSSHDECIDLRDTAIQAEPPVSAEAKHIKSQEGSKCNHRTDNQLASVQNILRVKTPSEILLELEWARQALLDRRKYLRSKRRVEKAAPTQEAK